MYEVQNDSYKPVTLFAGNFPVVTEIAATEDSTIKAGAPLKLADGKVAKITATGSSDSYTTDTDGAYGIAAADAENGYIEVYLTGEFRKEALVLEKNVDISAVKTAMRPIGIFIK